MFRAVGRPGTSLFAVKKPTMKTGFIECLDDLPIQWIQRDNGIDIIEITKEKPRQADIPETGVGLSRRSRQEVDCSICSLICRQPRLTADSTGFIAPWFSAADP